MSNPKKSRQKVVEAVGNQIPIQTDNIYKASLILVVCLFLASIWNYVYHYLPNAVFTHPFVFSIKTGLRGEMVTRLDQFITSYHPIFCCLMIPIAQRICPRMYFGKLGDLWIFYYVYIVAWNIDFILTYRTGNFRLVTSCILIAIQSYYCVWVWFKGRD